MDVLDALERLRSVEWIDEDGGPKNVVFQPGLTKAEVDALERRLGASLPEDYRRLLSVCAGIDGLSVDLDFSPASFESWASEALPHGVPFAHDGLGNYWTIDCLSESETESSIFFDCHDAPVLLYQGRGMWSFLLDLIRLEKGMPGSAIDAVHEDRLFDVWSKNPGTVAHAEALASSDPAIRAFAEELDGAFLLVDLRDAPVGMGFSSGRYGPNTRLRRFGEERLFAYAPGERKPGLLARMFGRGQSSAPLH